MERNGLYDSATRLGDSHRAEAATMEPTIANVLERFLEEEGERVSARTHSRTEHVIELLEDYLDGYAHEGLDGEDAARFARARAEEGGREFSDIFGPEHILPATGMFLNWFMVRKVMCGKDLLRAAGTVTKRLAAWLVREGYASSEEASAARDLGAEAARDLPRSREAADLLGAGAEGPGAGDEGDVEDYFTVVRIEPRGIWLEGMLDPQRIGPLKVPTAAARRLEEGWTIAGVCGRRGRSWRLLDVWNVYPA